MGDRKRGIDRNRALLVPEALEAESKQCPLERKPLFVPKTAPCLRSSFVARLSAEGRSCRPKTVSHHKFASRLIKLGDVPHRPSPPRRDNQSLGLVCEGGSLVQFNHRRFRTRYCLLLALLVSAIGLPSANAVSVSVSGSYEVIEKTGPGPQTKVLLRFHLTNHGETPLYLRQLILSDFSLPPAGASFTPSIGLSPGTTQQTSREFAIPRLQFDQWQKGVLPRVILELETKNGARTSLAIRLERIPSRNGR